MKIDKDNISIFKKISNDKLENKEAVIMAVMAKPSKQSFIVPEKDREFFQKEKTPKSEWEMIMQVAKDFDKFNLKLKNNQ